MAKKKQKVRQKIYLVRYGESYLANSIEKSRRVYTPFLEYAFWFVSKKDAERQQLKESDWVDSGYKWWHEWEDKKYEKNKWLKRNQKQNIR